MSQRVSTSQRFTSYVDQTKWPITKLRRCEFLISPSNTIGRTVTVYHSSDLVGLEICERRLDEHTRVLVAISLSQSVAGDSSLEDLFGVLVDSLAVLLRHLSNI